MKFDMTFSEALIYVLAGKGWVVGEHFRSGVVLSRGSMGTLMVKDFHNNTETPMVVSVRSLQQKYRAVYNQQEVM